MHVYRHELSAYYIESLGKLRMNMVLSYYPSDGGTVMAEFLRVE